MKIDKMLKGVREAKPATEKVASETASTPAPSNDKLLAALNGAMATKTASEAQVANPVDDVVKMAAEIANAEKEANVKEAQLMGIAFADAAIARIGEWQKTAAVHAPASNDDQLKLAAEAGYKQAIADMEKQAEEEYARGYNETVETIHKVASVQFVQAAKATQKMIQAAAQ
jgi:hypothetical protein